MPLTLIDIGGIPDKKNEKICASADFAVLVAQTSDDFKPWRQFCRAIDTKIIVEIISDYNAENDLVLTLDPDGIFRGTVHHLERGNLTIKDRPSIKQLAQVVVNLTRN